MQIKFPLADDVYMTDEGLKKRCVICQRLKELEDFPESKMHAFKRNDTCFACLELLKH